MSIMHHKVGKNCDHFTPKNLDKYVGKHFPVTRSSWERDFCAFCDANPNILKWSSEEIEIPYFDLSSSKQRRYFPDFWMKLKNKEGEIKTYLIEIKPSKETKPPRSTARKNKKSYLYEQLTYIRNSSKWEAARAFCAKRGWEFRLITEKELYRK